MKMQFSLKSALLDVCAGILALGLVLVVTVNTGARFDLRLVFLLTTVFFFLAGVVRGRTPPQSVWLKGLLVDSGSTISVLVLAWTGLAFNLKLVFGMFLLFSLVGALAGAHARRLWISRSRAKSATLSAVSLAAVLAAVVTGVPAVVKSVFTHSTNRPAPAFSLSTLDGKIVNSTDFRGHVVVMAFWATWCPPCREELPKVDQIHARYKGNPTVEFWAVDVKSGGETPQKATDYAKKTALGLPLAYDGQGAARSLGVQDIPTLMILDQAGHVRLIHEGYDASEHFVNEISNKIDALLGEGT